MLATVAFANETASGWQQAALATPVALAAGQTYVVSYSAPAGHYAVTNNYFAASYTSGPLVAPSSATAGGNGVYRYGPGGVFPTQTYNASNYWVDVVFQITDTTPPTAPATLTATASPGTVALSWPASTDNVGVDHYNVYRSTTSGFTPGPATLIGQSGTTSYTDAGLAAGTYYYRVIAVDAAGNLSGPSPQASGVVPADTTPPSVAITSPTGGSTVSGTTTVTASASDNVGVTSVQFLLDGANLGSQDTAAPYSVSWNTATASNGSHTLSAVARDAAGNTATASVTVTVNNVAAGLVAAWGFEEGAGTTAADSSGHSLNGTISNATWSTAGKFGDALSFNGTNSWVTVADNALLDLTEAMTLEAWVYPTAPGITPTTVVMKERGSNGFSYALYGADGAGQPPAGYIRRGSSNVSAVGTSALPLNTWTHLAATYDGATLRLYANGVQVASRAQTGSITTSTSPLRIGGNGVLGQYFTGLIDEVRIYSVALTPAQIQTDMNASVAGVPVLAAEGAVAGGAAPTLTPAELAPIVNEAIRRWQAAGLTAAEVELLRQVQFRIADLDPTAELGLTPIGGATVVLDDDGAGRGWFVDPTPAEGVEFGTALAPDALRATAGLAASGYDLLTVVMHELGHVLGLDDVNPAVDPNGLMSETLPLGTRHLIDAVSAAPGGAYAAGEDSLAGWGLLPGVWVG
ncbi:DUF4082 domain-containing protein [bacterium]|nr:DUF4082 domain-containing protein [bacterium]